MEITGPGRAVSPLTPAVLIVLSFQQFIVRTTISGSLVREDSAATEQELEGEESRRRSGADGRG